jgi:hypothetical protein
LKKYFTLSPAGQGVVERAGLLSKLQSAGDIVVACSGLEWPTTDHRPITARSPSQNGYPERFVGSIRRECFDHVIMLGEGHLPEFSNSMRTTTTACELSSVDKDASVIAQPITPARS